MAIIEGKRAFLYKLLPLDLYLKIIYRKYHHKRLNLKNPKLFSEKLFWLKKYNMNTQKDLIMKCYDKYLVRDYVKHKIGSEYLTELYGVFDDVAEIEFDNLPDKYIMKITQSCGFNIIHNEASCYTNSDICEAMKNWKKQQEDMKIIEKNLREESFYFDGNPRIICEECLQDKDGNIPNDVRFFCFNGIPQFFCIDYDTIDESGNKKHDFFYRNVYSIDGTFIPVEIGRPNNPKIQMPHIKNFSKMVEISKKLSEDFLFVRVDLYNVDGRIIFGELTWMPQGGNMPINPKEYDYKFGTYLNLPL